MFEHSFPALQAFQPRGESKTLWPSCLNAQETRISEEHLHVFWGQWAQHLSGGPQHVDTAPASESI